VLSSKAIMWPGRAGRAGSRALTRYRLGRRGNAPRTQVAIVVGRRSGTRTLSTAQWTHDGRFISSESELESPLGGYSFLEVQVRLQSLGNDNGAILLLVVFKQRQPRPSNRKA
jgi:hypothetical protein